MSPDLDAKIREFDPTDGSFLPLEDLFESAFASENPADYYDAIFNLFERFPEDDGAGVFWSAVHGMEAVGGYETKLLMYFRRFPSEITKTMLIRLRNSGIESVDGMKLAALF